jgi:hypothetical protein
MLWLASALEAQNMVVDTAHAVNSFSQPRVDRFLADRKLKKIPAHGGISVTLCDAPSFSRGASWGDDGSIVAAFNGGTTGLVRVSSSSGALAALTQLRKEKGEEAHGWPQVLPGAQAVLFTAYGTGAFDDGEINAVSLKTGERKTVYKGGFLGRYLSSGHLVFLASEYVVCGAL